MILIFGLFALFLASIYIIFWSRDIQKRNRLKILFKKSSQMVHSQFLIFGLSGPSLSLTGRVTICSYSMKAFYLVSVEPIGTNLFHYRTLKTK